jgi:hypothetical protein
MKWEQYYFADAQLCPWYEKGKEATYLHLSLYWAFGMPLITASSNEVITLRSL